MFGSTRKESQEHDPAEALVREVGAQLRQARQARGEKIEMVAEILRIRPTYLFGLEQGDLSVIPGRTYALGFLRSYAQYLGFDGDDLIAQIKSSVGDLTGRAHLHGRAPLSESRLPKVPILVVSLAALAGTYVGWAYVADSGRSEIELVAEVPDDLQEMGVAPLEMVLPPVPLEDAQSGIEPAAEPVPEPTTESEPATAMPQVGGLPDPAPIVAEQAPVAGAEGDSSDSNTVESIEPEPSINEARARAPESDAAEGALVPVEPAPVVARPEQSAGDQEIEASVRSAADILAALEPVAATGAEPQIYRTDDARTRVILRARDNAWVHVSSTNNDYLWVKTLQPGDAFVVPDRPDLVLWTGNAGGIEVIVDGAPLPPLGPDAGVVRDVSLQPRALLRRLLPVPAAAPSL